MLTITPTELNTLIKSNPASLTLIDVRRTEEYQEVHIAGSENIPLHILPLQLDHIKKDKQVICICRSGARSGQACQFLEDSGIPAKNLIGGMLEYEKLYPSGVTHPSKK